MSNSNSEKRITWHRLFGLALQDYLLNTAYEVEMELDLARKRQILDILIIRRRDADAEPLREPCDGLEGLRTHNLVTYKSDHESLTPWTIKELVGHFVNYRKAYAPNVPEKAIGLYAITTRYPRKLLQSCATVEVHQGVYQLAFLDQFVTLIVLKCVAAESRNALWELFSFDAERIREGIVYQWRDSEHVSILHEIYSKYSEQGFCMGYSFDDLRRDVALSVLPTLPPEERLRGLPPEERLRGLPPEERLRGLLPEELLHGLSAEQRRQLKELLAEGEKDGTKIPKKKSSH